MPQASARVPFESGLIGIVVKVTRGCAIAAPGRIGCIGRRRRLLLMRLPPFGVSATPASR